MPLFKCVQCWRKAAAEEEEKELNNCECVLFVVRDYACVCCGATRQSLGNVRLRNIDIARGTELRFTTPRHQFVCNTCRQTTRRRVAKSERELRAAVERTEQWRLERSVEKQVQKKRGRQPATESPLTPRNTPSMGTRSKKRQRTPQGRSESVQYEAIEEDAALLALGSERLVPESAWRMALRGHFCPFGKDDCGARPLNLIQRREWGGIVTYVAQCKKCNALTAFRSDVDAPERVSLGQCTYRASFVHRYLTALLYGVTFVQAKAMDDRLTESMWYALQAAVEPVLVARIEQRFKDFRAQLAEECRQDGRKLVLCINGAWSHRGRKARAHSFAVRDFHTMKVVCNVVIYKKHCVRRRNKNGVWREVIVVKGTYVGNSKRMEGHAFEMALDQLEEAGLSQFVDVFVCDDDSTVALAIKRRQALAHASNANDPGHRVRNFLKRLVELFGQRRDFKGMAHRLGKFLMRCIKRTVSEVAPGSRSEEAIDERVAYFKKMWRFAKTTHYTMPECGEDCPCNQHYGVDSDDLVDFVDDDDEDDEDLEENDGLLLLVGVNGELVEEEDEDEDDDDKDDKGEYEEEIGGDELLEDEDEDSVLEDTVGKVTEQFVVATESELIEAGVLDEAIDDDDDDEECVESEADLMLKTIVELKKMCKDRNLTVGGKKADVVNRLLDAPNSSSSSSSSSCELTGWERVEYERIVLMKANDIKAECKVKGVPVTGSKDVLARRLVEWMRADRMLKEQAPDQVIKEYVAGPKALLLRRQRNSASAMNNVKPRVIKKKIFDLHKAKHKRLFEKAVLIMEKVESSIDSVLHGVNTCGSESINFVRLSHCPKHRYFPRSYALRSLTSACQANFGIEATYTMFCETLQMNPLESTLKTARDSDCKRGKHTERKSNVEYKQRVKECRARRLSELKEENLADASAKQALQIRHTYNTNAVIPPPTQQLVEMVDDDVDDVLAAETDSSSSNEAPRAHLQ